MDSEKAVLSRCITSRIRLHEFRETGHNFFFRASTPAISVLGDAGVGVESEYPIDIMNSVKVEWRFQETRERQLKKRNDDDGEVKYEETNVTECRILSNLYKKDPFVLYFIPVSLRSNRVGSLLHQRQVHISIYVK